MTTRGDLSNNAVPTAGTNLTSTDGGDDNRGEPKKKKPWDAYPNFTVNIQCGKCKNYKSRIGCDGNGNDGEPETWSSCIRPTFLAI